MIEKEAHSCWFKLLVRKCLLQFIEFDANEVLKYEERCASWFRVGVMRDLLIFKFCKNFDFVVDLEAFDSGSGVCFGVVDDFFQRLIVELEINENSFDDFVVGIRKNRFGLSSTARELRLRFLLLMLLNIDVQT